MTEQYKVNITEVERETGTTLVDETVTITDKDIALEFVKDFNSRVREPWGSDWYLYAELVEVR